MPNLTLVGDPYPHPDNEKQVLVHLCCGSETQPLDHKGNSITEENISNFETYLQETVILKTCLQFGSDGMRFRINDKVEFLPGFTMPALIISNRDGSIIMKDQYKKIKEALLKVVDVCNKQLQSSEKNRLFAVSTTKTPNNSPVRRHAAARRK